MLVVPALVVAFDAFPWSIVFRDVQLLSERTALVDDRVRVVESAARDLDALKDTVARREAQLADLQSV